MMQTVTLAKFPDDLPRFGMTLIDKAEVITNRVTFLPLRPTSIADLELYMREHSITEMIILDQKVLDVESQSSRTDFGYLYEKNGLKITVIDHHVQDSEFQKLSTGNLVIRYLQSHPVSKDNLAVCITHKDCDSLLSALMIIGALPPHKEFATAVLAADHNAQQNPIADLLQSIEECPKAGEILKPERFTFSVRALGALLANRKMDPRAKDLFDARSEARSSWVAKLSDFRILENGTYYYVFSNLVSSDPCPEFVPALLPKAQVILVFHNSPSDPQFIQIRAVLGAAAKPQVAIDHVDLIRPIVEGFGGRVDAGSNRRSSISIKDPHVVAAAIDLNLKKLLSV